MSAGVFTVRSSMQHARTLATQAHARRALNVPSAATTTIATHDTKGTIRNVDAGCDFSGRAMIIARRAVRSSAEPRVRSSNVRSSYSARNRRNATDTAAAPVSIVAIHPPRMNVSGASDDPTAPPRKTVVMKIDVIRPRASGAIA